MKILMKEAAALLGVSPKTVRRLTREYDRGECYATVAGAGRLGRDGAESSTVPVTMRRIRGQGAGTLFRPGDRKGFRRHWDQVCLAWMVEVDDVAEWAVRAYSLTDPALAYNWAVMNGAGGLDWRRALEAAARRLTEQEHADAPG